MSASHEVDCHDPLELFDSWLNEAEESEPNDANAAALATSAADGAPSVRMVLVKQIAGQRFSFFTNAESRKGREVAENPRAALCFHWKTLRRQVRVEGPIAELDASAVDAYFHSRPRESQIGAAISDQSRVLASRAELEEKARRFAELNRGEIPRPAYWRGYSVSAERMEFWIGGANRLHDRFLFTKQGGRRQKVRLYP
jgi:pyridoxamine 5'-phosphate oxidase